MIGPLNENVLSVGRTASGHLYLALTSEVGWEDFPDYVEAWLARCSGEVVSRHDAVDIRVWKVLIEGQLLLFVYDDFPVMISLESQGLEGDVLIEAFAVGCSEKK